MAGEATHFDNDGKSVQVTLSYTVLKDYVAVVEGWLGIAGGSGDSGDMISLATDDRAYQFTVPTALAVEKGDIVYIEVADLTGHYPDDSAYSKTAGAGKVAFFKAQDDQDANDVVIGRILAANALAS
jgi:hypothetical protein